MVKLGGVLLIEGQMKHGRSRDAKVNSPLIVANLQSGMSGGKRSGLIT